MAAMPSPAGWAAFAVVIGLIATAWITIAKALSAPSPPYGQGGYGNEMESEKQRRYADRHAGDRPGGAGSGGRT